MHWEQPINFTSTLLLRSCITLLPKEISNVIRFIVRLSNRRRDRHGVRTSIIPDGYTSVLPHDENGKLSGLYYTNTGLALAVVLNLFMKAPALNIIVCVTIGIT